MGFVGPIQHSAKREFIRSISIKITMVQNNNRGFGGGSLGWGRGRRRQSNKLQNSKSPKIKFYPHRSGKQCQDVTYATIKEHIISYAQRTYHYGKDIVGSLWDLMKLDLNYNDPHDKCLLRRTCILGNWNRMDSTACTKPKWSNICRECKLLRRILTGHMHWSLEPIASKPFRDG